MTDGRSQRYLYQKDETASPTVSTEALMISLSIDVWEKRDITTADVNVAYLHAEMENFIIFKFEG